MNGSEQCFYSAAERCVIDVLRPDGKTAIYGSTLEGARQKYPDVEVCSLDEAVEKIERAFISEPVEIDEDAFRYALEVLPPVGWTNLGGSESFKMSERLSGAITGVYARIRDRYWTFNDRITIKHAEIVAKIAAHLGAEG